VLSCFAASPSYLRGAGLDLRLLVALIAVLPFGGPSASVSIRTFTVCKLLGN
jgi:hypothetical protein